MSGRNEHQRVESAEATVHSLANEIASLGENARLGGGESQDHLRFELRELEKDPKVLNKVVAELDSMQHTDQNEPVDISIERNQNGQVTGLVFNAVKDHGQRSVKEQENASERYEETILTPRESQELIAIKDAINSGDSASLTKALQPLFTSKHGYETFDHLAATRVFEPYLVSYSSEGKGHLSGVIIGGAGDHISGTYSKKGFVPDANTRKGGAAGHDEGEPQAHRPDDLRD